MIMIRDLFLHLKSLIWCLNKNGDRYNLKMILDSLNARHIPESIQMTPLGRNLTYLIHELSTRGGVQPLLKTLRKIRSSETGQKTPEGEIELGQYLQTTRDLDELPPGTFGVISFLGPIMRGLFYLEDRGLVEKPVTLSQVRVLPGTTIE